MAAQPLKVYVIEWIDTEALVGRWSTKAQNIHHVV